MDPAVADRDRQVSGNTLLGVRASHWIKCPQTGTWNQSEGSLNPCKISQLEPSPQHRRLACEGNDGTGSGREEGHQGHITQGAKQGPFSVSTITSIPFMTLIFRMMRNFLHPYEKACPEGEEGVYVRSTQSPIAASGWRLFQKVEWVIFSCIIVTIYLHHVFRNSLKLDLPLVMSKLTTVSNSVSSQ